MSAWVAIAVASVLFGGFRGLAGTAPEERVGIELLPDASELGGWTLAELPRVVAGPELFELIDGGAEIYQEYGFERAVSCRYQRGASALQLELYEMTDGAAAYGVYSMMQSPHGAPTEVGQEARLAHDYLVFWKGRFFGSLTFTGESASAAHDLTVVAQQVAARITQTSEPPAVIRLLPQRGLRDCRYLRGPIALANVYVFGDGDLFGTRDAACGVYADRREFVFVYESDVAAGARLAALSAALQTDSSYREFTTRSDGFRCTDADGHLIVAVRQDDRLVLRLVAAVDQP